MQAITKQREKLFEMINNLTENEVFYLINFITNNIINDDEPPLNEDEIAGLEIAKRELAEGKGLPFDEVLKELW